MSFTCKLPIDSRNFNILCEGERCRPGCLNGPLVSRPGPVTVPLECSGLLFDTGDVLFDETAWWRWVVRLLAHLGTRVHYLDLYRIWRREYLSEVNCGGREYWEAFRAFLRSAGLSRAQIDEVVLASQPKLRQFIESVRPLPGVKATLARFSAQGMPMGALSSGGLTGQCAADRLHGLGIGVYFHTILSSSDLRLRASDCRPYLAAAEALGTEATTTVFVGHDADQLKGAASAGMATIAYNYDQDARADVFLDRFDQLAQTVRMPPSSHRQAG